MKDNTVEYAEESIRNLLILVKGFSEYFLEQGFFHKKDFIELMYRYLTMNECNSFIAIPMACVHCGRKAFARLDEDANCIFCGGELHFDLNAPDAEEVLSSVDAGKLFSYSVQPSDISAAERFVYYASGTITPPSTSNRDSSSDAYGSLSPFEKEQLMRSQYTVTNHQFPVNRLGHVMASMWNMISKDHPEAGSMILKHFLTIDDKKRKHVYESIYTPVLCTKCQTEQWPSSLILSTCSACSEPLPVKLLPGLLQLQVGTGGDAIISPRIRKLEYLYSLFEAVFSCASSAYSVSYEDLAKIISEKFTVKEYKSENSLCTSCQRPISLSHFFTGQCPYCGSTNNELFVDQFF